MYFQMHINLTTVVEFSRQLTAYTRGASLFSDKMDVIYLAYIMEKLIVFVDEVEDVRCLLYAEKKYHLEMKSWHMALFLMYAGTHWRVASKTDCWLQMFCINCDVSLCAKKDNSVFFSDDKGIAA